MEIHDFDLQALSQLSYRIRVCKFEGKWNPSALILEFSGTYGRGSQGNADADFIAAIKAAALAILHVEAVVYDFREMAYEWGNRIWDVLPSSSNGGETMLPVAMVISDKCRKGFSGCAEMLPPMFDSLDDALRYIEGPTRAAVNELMRDVD
jgi:hypothetical protein